MSEQNFLQQCAERIAKAGDPDFFDGTRPWIDGVYPREAIEAIQKCRTNGGVAELVQMLHDKIEDLQRQVDFYRSARDAAIDDCHLRGKEIEKLRSLVGEDTTGRPDGYTTGKAM